MNTHIANPDALSCFGGTEFPCFYLCVVHKTELKFLIRCTSDIYKRKESRCCKAMSAVQSSNLNFLFTYQDIFVRNVYLHTY